MVAAYRTARFLHPFTASFIHKEANMNLRHLLGKARSAKDDLGILLNHLSEGMKESGITGRYASSPALSTGFRSLDLLLSGTGFPRGASVEVCTSDYELLAEFARRFLHAAIREERISLLLDPFDEFSYLREYTNENGMIVQLREKDPLKLATAAMHFFQIRGTDLVLLSPGLIWEKNLADGSRNRTRSQVFQRTLGSFYWAAKRSDCIVVLLRLLPFEASFPSLGWSSIRLRLFRDADPSRARVRIEQHAHEPEACGRTTLVDLSDPWGVTVKAEMRPRAASLPKP